MTDPFLYRKDVKEAARIFRPLLQALKIRDADGHRLIFLAEFDELAFLNLDKWTIQLTICDLNADGIFMIRCTEQGRVQAYIFLSRNLYKNQSKDMREIRKMVGVHEFVHFLAIIYVATFTNTDSLRSTNLLNRLQHTVDRLWGPESIELYRALSGRAPKSKSTPLGLTDTHYRTDHEGDTLNYAVLFLYLLFSRELFETYFDKTKQTEFKRLYATKATKNNAIKLLLGTLEIAANDKDIPYATAKSQLSEWAHVYMRE